MNARSRERLRRLLRDPEKVLPPSLQVALPAGLVIIAAAYTVTFFACAIARVTFGFELSWLESGMQAMTDRVAAHRSLYVEPSPAYVPFIYPPLYYVAASGLTLLVPSLGPFTPMRAISLAATVATAATVFATLGRRPLLGLRRRLLLSALFLAFFGRFEFWHDTSRVDSLFVFLLFSATALLLEGRGAASAIATGCLGGAAILTKQPALPLLIGAAAVSAIARRRPARAAGALAIASATVLGGLAALGELRNPWLYYYLLRVPTTHAILPRSLASSAAFLCVVMPLAVLVAGLELWRQRRLRLARGAAPSALDDPTADGRHWALTFAAWTAIVFVLRLKQGASINFFLPLVPVGILVVASALERWGRRGEPLLLLQFLVLLYNPLAAIPTAADWRAGFELLGALRRIPGPVFLPQFPAYLSMLGKPPVAHGVAVCDLVALRPDLLRVIDAQIAAGQYAAAMPWRADEPGQPADRCRPQSFGRPFHTFDSIPQGGDFFAASHGAKLARIEIFDAEPIATANRSVDRGEPEQ